jgi:hypothetical protein
LHGYALIGFVSAALFDSQPSVVVRRQYTPIADSARKVISDPWFWARAQIIRFGVPRPRGTGGVVSRR